MNTVSVSTKNYQLKINTIYHPRNNQTTGSDNAASKALSPLKQNNLSSSATPQKRQVESNFNVEKLNQIKTGKDKLNMAVGATSIKEFSALKNTEENTKNSLNKVNQPPDSSNKYVEKDEAIKPELNIASNKNNSEKLDQVKTETTNAYMQYLDSRNKQTISSLSKEEVRTRLKGQIHLTAGKQYLGLPKYNFKMGVDGNQYAVSVSMNVNATPINENPIATITKMQGIYNAALAPANPSFDDVQIALQSLRTITDIRLEQMHKALEKQSIDKIG